MFINQDMILISLQRDELLYNQFMYRISETTEYLGKCLGKMSTTATFKYRTNLFNIVCMKECHASLCLGNKYLSLNCIQKRIYNLNASTLYILLGVQIISNIYTSFIIGMVYVQSSTYKEQQPSIYYFRKLYNLFQTLVNIFALIFILMLTVR